MTIQIINEVKKQAKDGDFLCLQQVIYPYADDKEKEGYRFIWRTSDGNMIPSRGQARIPSLAITLELISKAMSEGWGNFSDDCF